MADTADTLNADLRAATAMWRAAVAAESRDVEARCMKRLDILLDRLIEASRPESLIR